MSTDKPADNLLGTVRRSPDGRMLAVLWPSDPSPQRWMVTDQWGSCGYETNAVVAKWPVVGAVPFSPAAGMSLAPVSAEPAESPCPIHDIHIPHSWMASNTRFRCPGWPISQPLVSAGSDQTGGTPA